MLAVPLEHFRGTSEVRYSGTIIYGITNTSNQFECRIFTDDNYACYNSKRGLP